MISNLKKRVISVCTLEHKDVWKLTSQLLPKFVEADEYIVYVPHEEFSEFKFITHKQIQVVSEKSLERLYQDEIRKKLQSIGKESRFGWYFQQFLKIEALEKSDADVTIIWDADCVPVSKINLLSDDGIPKYLRASEFHQEYFICIEKLLGMKRTQNFSFIVPGFPMPKEWIKNFLEDIRKYNNGLAWNEALIQAIDFSQKSGFSEFETMGTWVFHNHQDEIIEARYKWERFGQSKFGLAKDLDYLKVIELGKTKNLDVISFENWDVKPRFRRIIDLVTLIKSVISKGRNFVRKSMLLRF